MLEITMKLTKEDYANHCPAVPGGMLDFDISGFEENVKHTGAEAQHFDCSHIGQHICCEAKTYFDLFDPFSLVLFR